MASEAANLAASVSKSLEVDRSPGATQRASEVAQDQLAGESVAALTRKKPDAADEIRKSQIKRDHERRRREMERKTQSSNSGQHAETDDDGGLDVVA